MHIMLALSLGGKKQRYVAKMMMVMHGTDLIPMCNLNL